MAFLNASDRRFMQTIAQLAYCNPFLPPRIELERQALGAQFVDAPPVWSRREDLDSERKNIEGLLKRIVPLVDRLRGRLAKSAAADDTDLALYEDLALYLLYYRYRWQLHETAAEVLKGAGPRGRIAYWEPFRKDFEHYLRIVGRTLPTGHDPAHTFACFFQLRRAFFHIFHYIVGGSMPAAKLRAAVWQSITTHDMRRYQRSLYNTMGDITTLITGPSGTGKELVARAIGLSRYIPFNARTQQFAEDFAGSFHALNLSALSPTLIESELFGHKRGSFTGAMSDRVGWLEVCPALGTVFLDEIGELAPTLQVKLLRVLQTRTFQRLGETTDRRFQGKIIAATNRDLAAEMHTGRFRQDFYYRLCSDTIHTPSLKEQISDSPTELHNLILHIARRITSDEADALADEVHAWIEQHLGLDYAWPGNIRELEQCVRNVMIRKEYRPPTMAGEGEDASPTEALTAAMRQGELTADELLNRYCTLVYAQAGSYEEAARRLKLDRRTVKSRVDQQLLRRLT